MLFIDQNQNRFPTAASAQGPTVQGGGADNTDLYTTMWYQPSDVDSSTKKGILGSRWFDETTGNVFMYVKAAAGLNPGQFVSFAAPTTGTVTASGSTTAAVITNITTTVNEVGNYLWTLDAVGVYSAGSTPFKQSLRSIKSSTIGATATFTLSVQGTNYGNNVYDLDKLPSVPTNGSACVVIRPFNVIVATASTTPIGVALGLVTSGNYTIIQIAGIAMVQANNVIGPTIVGLPGAMQAAGVFSGPTSGAQTVGNIQTVIGTSILPLVALNSATTSLIPAYINFLGT